MVTCASFGFFKPKLFFFQIKAHHLLTAISVNDGYEFIYAMLISLQVEQIVCKWNLRLQYLKHAWFLH